MGLNRKLCLFFIIGFFNIFAINSDLASSYVNNDFNSDFGFDSVDVTWNATNLNCSSSIGISDFAATIQNITYFQKNSCPYIVEVLNYQSVDSSFFKAKNKYRKYAALMIVFLVIIMILYFDKFI